MICHYWCFKGISYKFEPHVCNKCYDISMMVYGLENIAILDAKSVDSRCVLWNITKNDAINRLNNSKFDDKSTLSQWTLVHNKTPVEVIKKGVFRETCFRDIYGKWYKSSWNRFDELKNIDLFWEHNGWINFTDPDGQFQWYFKYWLGRRSLDDQREITRWKGIVSRFKGKLTQMIKDDNGRFDDCSISLNITQILLHWSYELGERDLFFLFI